MVNPSPSPPVEETVPFPNPPIREPKFSFTNIDYNPKRHKPMAMTESKSSSRWEGETWVELQGITAEQVWPFIEDFCNIQKLIPIETCFQLEGVHGQPGLIRYCALTIADDADPEKTVMKWAKEKLVVIDPIQHRLTYEVLDNNMGLKSYVATIKLLPIISDGNSKPTDCKIQWSFACDPVEGWTFEALFSLIQSFNQSTAKKMELACSQDKSM
ncbi:hypothetical protein VNO77_11014 [Canavalia gladiata]|uniref:Uncharacterized protein n=1 Tax=Canavalia gladiata TaxID=3824 RepID=A0AAN9MGI7_CANGL